MFFKTKKDFEKAVQAEVDRREQERKKKAQEMWEEWEKENTVEVRFSEKQELQQVYLDAEALYKAGEYKEADLKLNEYINRFLLLDGEVLGLYVFILMIDIKKALNDKESTLKAYDNGIDYYSSVKGEYVEGWLEHLKVAKQAYIKEEELIEGMRERYEFDLAPELIIALQRLEGIAVYKIIQRAEKWESFDTVWRAVQKEVEAFEKDGVDKRLNKTTYKGAKNWVKSFAHLCSEDVPEEYRK